MLRLWHNLPSYLNKPFTSNVHTTHLRDKASTLPMRTAMISPKRAVAAMEVTT